MDRYRIFRRGKIWYLEHDATGKQTSLHTRDKQEAQRILNAQYEAHQNPSANLQIARIYMNVADEKYAKRTWDDVFRHIIEGYSPKSESYRRWGIAKKDEAYDLIRHKPVAETRPEDFKDVLTAGTVSTNVYLRRMQNYAVDMNWLMMPILPKRQFPKPQYKSKRAITQFEHERILAREGNEERKAFFEMLWETGGSQGDIAKLENEDIKKATRVISFDRLKTRNLQLKPASLKYGDSVAELLTKLPQSGRLFPYLATVRSSDRATEFHQRCEGLGIEGVTLHSYRYAWAERAKACGFPERYAMAALGHNSKAVSRAYAKGAAVEIPSLEEFERQAMEEKRRAA